MRQIVLLASLIIITCVLFSPHIFSRITSTPIEHLEIKMSAIMVKDSANNATNITLVPVYMVNITLTNGSIIGFQSIDNATAWILNATKRGIISPQNISHMDFILIQDWGKIKHFVNISANETVNVTYYPGYRLFFVHLFNASQFNYTGKIGVVMYNDWFNQRLGYSIHKFLYGPLPEINMISVFNDTITTSNINTGLVLMFLIDSSYENTTMIVLNKLHELTGVNKVILIDLSNNRTQFLQVLQASNITNTSLNIIPVLDCNITIKDKHYNITYNSSLEAFGFEARIPSVVGIWNGLIVWKSQGFASLDELKKTILTLDEMNLLGIAKYDLLNVSVINLFVNKTATIYITLSDGFGNVSVTVTYRFLTEQNETIGAPKNSSAQQIHPRIFALYGIFVPNGSKYLEIYLVVHSEYVGTQYYGPFIFEIKTKEKEKGPPGLGIETIVGAIIGIIILAIVIYIYRKIR